MGHPDRDQLLIVPAGAELHGQWNGNRGANFPQNVFHQRKIAQQSGTAVALHYLIDGAAEVDIHNVEPEILARSRGVRHYLRIRSEKLRRDGMLFRLEIEIAKRPRRLFASCLQRCDDAVRAGELSHDESAAALVAN